MDSGTPLVLGYQVHIARIHRDNGRRRAACPSRIGYSTLLFVSANSPEESTAQPLYCRALTIDEAAYCPQHPKVAIRLNNLVQLMQTTNWLAEAEPLMRRACSIHVRSYGVSHPSTQAVAKSFRGLLQAMELDDAAIERRVRELLDE